MMRLVIIVAGVVHATDMVSSRKSVLHNFKESSTVRQPVKRTVKTHTRENFDEVHVPLVFINRDLAAFRVAAAPNPSKPKKTNSLLSLSKSLREEVTQHFSFRVGSKVSTTEGLEGTVLKILPNETFVLEVVVEPGQASSEVVLFTTRLGSFVCPDKTFVDRESENNFDNLSYLHQLDDDDALGSDEEMGMSCEERVWVPHIKGLDFKSFYGPFYSYPDPQTYYAPFDPQQHTQQLGCGQVNYGGRFQQIRVGGNAINLIGSQESYYNPSGGNRWQIQCKLSPEGHLVIDPMLQTLAVHYFKQQADFDIVRRRYNKLPVYNNILEVLLQKSPLDMVYESQKIAGAYQSNVVEFIKRKYPPYKWEMFTKDSINYNLVKEQHLQQLPKEFHTLNENLAKALGQEPSFFNA